jgi:hypothetical protein
MALKEVWFVKNNSYSPISILDIMVSYTVNPEETVDLIAIGNTSESVSNSITIRNAALLIVGSGENVGKKYLDSEYLHSHDEFSLTTHTHDGLDVLTGGPTSDASSLHTHGTANIPVYSSEPDPSASTIGDVYFNSTDSKLYVFNGINWVGIALS